MQITRDTATMFIELAPQISQKLGVNIGYIHPRIALIQDTTEFVIREPALEHHHNHDGFTDDADEAVQTSAEEIQFLHMSDLHFQRSNGIISHWVEEVKSDDKVQELIDKVNEAIKDGKIYFAAGVTRTKEGEEMQVTQRVTNNGTVVYELPIVGPHGTLWTYATVVALAPKHPSFAFAKKIIDDQWPDEWSKWLRAEVARQADNQPVEKSQITLADKAWSLFKKLFQ